MLIVVSLLKELVLASIRLLYLFAARSFPQLLTIISWSHCCLEILLWLLFLFVLTRMIPKLVFSSLLMFKVKSLTINFLKFRSILLKSGVDVIVRSLLILFKFFLVLELYIT